MRNNSLIISEKKLINVIGYLIKNLALKNKLRVLTSFILMLSSGLFELVSLASIYPIIRLFLDADYINDLNFAESFIFKFKIDYFLEARNMVFFAFFIILTLATLFKILSIRLNYRLSAFIGLDIENKIFRNDLYLSYSDRINKNSNQIISALTNQIQFVISSINYFLTASLSAVLFFSIAIGLLAYSTRITIYSLILVLIIYLFFYKFVRKRINNNSKSISYAIQERVKLIQESQGAGKDIILNNNQEKYLKIFNTLNRVLRFKAANNQILSSLPRYITEFIIILLVVSYVYVLSSDNQLNDKESIIASIGVFIFGLQKMLPSAQSFYNSWASAKSYSASLIDIVNLLKLKVDISSSNYYKKLYDFQKGIYLRNLSFYYKDPKKVVLKDFNLDIEKGTFIGIKGKSGLGKSTLIDLIIGLLKPKKGSILIDDIDISLLKNIENLKLWRSSISYVPQSIFLADLSIKENIAFSSLDNNINFDRVIGAAKTANIHNFIISLPNGYDTKVGERGILLSGGQRQRIGIARAIYKPSNLLVLDESTSNIDYETEKKILIALRSLDKELTIVLISHSSKALEICDTIIDLSSLKKN